MQKELYITGINENGFFKYDKQYSEFKINRLNKYYFTIKIGNGYLSAKPDGGYSIQSIAREWEYFFINPMLFNVINRLSSIPQAEK